MNKGINILVIGRCPEIMGTMLRLINNESLWEAQGCLSDDEAIAYFDKHTYDMVLYSSGIDSESEERLSAYFKMSKPEVPVIQHYGGGSGLLYAEIKMVLHGKGAYIGSVSI